MADGNFVALISIIIIFTIMFGLGEIWDRLLNWLYLEED
jgi:hypothetical protein